MIDGTSMKGRFIADWFSFWFFRVDDGCFDSELKLGFGRPIELLVDGRISAIEDDVRAGTIGVALKDDCL